MPSMMNNNVNNQNNNKAGSSRHVIGFTILFTLCIQSYIMFLFHRSAAGRQLSRGPASLRFKERRRKNGGLRGSQNFLRQQQRNKTNKTGRYAPDKVWPKPDGWETYGFRDIRTHFDCHSYAHDSNKPLPTDEDWDFFKNKYNEVVDESAKFDDPVPGTLGYTLIKEEGGDGGLPPYHAAHGKVGRGLFASRDIKEGELVHDGTQSDIEFPSGMAWRRYVFSLPRNKACDVIDWSWTQKTSEDGEYKIFSAMNISILSNGAQNDEEFNVNPRESTSSKYYATRDIKKGEELMTDYDVYETVWDQVGLKGLE